MRRACKAWLVSAAAGAAALGAVSAWGEFLGFAWKLNALTLGIAGVLGLPGIIALLLARLLLKIG